MLQCLYMEVNFGVIIVGVCAFIGALIGNRIKQKDGEKEDIKPFAIKLMIIGVALIILGYTFSIVFSRI